MLTARTKTGKNICLGYDYNKEALLSLRKKEEFVCPICGENLLLKLGNQRIFHFAHKPGSHCREFYENESFEHMEGKRQLFQWLLSQKIPSMLEYYDSEIQQRPDIMFRYKGKKYSLEFQCSTLPEDTFIKRTKTYLENNYIPLWIISGKHMHQKSNDIFSLSNFQYLFLRSTASGILYIPAYDPEKQLFQLVETIASISIKNTLAKYSYYPLHKIELDTLLEPAKCISTQSSWNPEIEKLILNWSLHPQPGHRSFFQELYSKGLNFFLLPPEIGLPVVHSILIQTPPIIWQTYLYLDVLAKKNPKDYITLQEVDLHLNKRKGRNEIIIRNLPQLGHLNPILAQFEYLQQLVQLGILLRKGNTVFQLQKKIYLPKSNREREEARKDFYQKNIGILSKG